MGQFESNLTSTDACHFVKMEIHAWLCCTDSTDWRSILEYLLIYGKITDYLAESFLINLPVIHKTVFWGFYATLLAILRQENSTILNQHKQTISKTHR
jgi:hypothetical protein